MDNNMDMSAYLGVFLDEVDEQIQLLDEEVLNLEQDGDNPETIQRIFRAAHTLKGSSAAMGFDKMKELTHKVENVFDLIRNQQIKLNGTIINTVFKCIDCIKDMKEQIIKGTLDTIDISAYISELECIQSSSVEEVVTSELEVKDNPIQAQFPEIKLDTYQKSIIEKAIENNYTVQAVFVGLIEKSMLKSVRAFLIQNNLKEIGEIIASFPGTEEIEDESKFEGNLVYLLATKASQQEIITIVNNISDINTVSLVEITNENIASFDQGKVVQLIEKQEPTPIEDTKQSKSEMKIQQTVRVDVDRLEHLINLVGELVIDQTRLNGVRGRLSDRYQNDEDIEVFNEISHHLSHVVSELQEGMMKTRMLPIEQLFNRFPRMVRDLAQKAKKEFDFIIEGKETELDRNLIEEIGDPIIHLLRNSIDHGIELPEDRERANKPKKGKVILRAAHEENHIVIKISDDGKGIDVNKVKQSAIRKGMITEIEAERMSDKDIVLLIFKSGVSTAEKVTDISGRGVGMDIVRSHIENLNGMIDIDTELGIGTTFTIKLPLTLAIIRSLLVRFGEKRFAIPLANVQEIVRMQRDEIKMVQNQEVGIIRGSMLPLVRMHKRFGSDECELLKRKRVFVVVIGLAEKRVGLIVDETLGNQEIVIKSLGKYIGSPPFITGATIMGDGNVALILDAGSIVRKEGTDDLHKLVDEPQNIKQVEKTTKIATFLLGEEEYGMNIEHVHDIITVPKITAAMNSPEYINGMINLRGSLIPVMDLHSRLAIPKRAQTKKTRIIITEVEKQTVGMLVDHVTEILNVIEDKLESPLKKGQTVENYVKGVIHLENRLISLVDLTKIVNIKEKDLMEI